MAGADFVNQNGGVNPLYDPTLISPKISKNVSFDPSGRVPWVLPAHAFQVIRLRLKIV